MKKGTKSLAAIALILFAVGCAVLLIAGLAGGFEELRAMDDSDIPLHDYISLDIDGAIHEIKDEFQKKDNQQTENGSDADMDVTAETEGTESTGEETENNSADDNHNASKEPREGSVRLDLTANSLEDLELELSACTLKIAESEDDHVWLLMEGDSDRVKYEVQKDSLKLRTSDLAKSWVNDWSNISKKLMIYLYLPVDCHLQKLDIKMKAGFVECVPVYAKVVEAECDAGEFQFKGLSGDKIEFETGAGSALFDSLWAKESKLVVGAGSIEVDDMSIEDKLVLDIGMGSGKINGRIDGELDADCGMGELIMKLTGSEEEYDYDLECSMGSLSVNNNSYSDYEKNSGNDKKIDVECSMGNVEIQFSNK